MRDGQGPRREAGQVSDLRKPVVTEDFPIRCGAYASTSRTYCGEPAVLAVTLKPDCGCPAQDVTVCRNHAERFAVGYRRERKRHKACGRRTSYEVVATRPLNEGDLP